MTVPPDYDPADFPPFAVTCDTAVFTTRDSHLMVVLIQRANHPHRGKWALPGGFVDIDEDLDVAAIRELEEETGIAVNDVTQIGAYGTPGRDPRMRVVSIAYVADLEDLADPVGGSDASDARLWPVDQVLADPTFLAFDHHEILTDAVKAMDR